jgi:hydroxymethylglutaryl-CoA reductase
MPESAKSDGSFKSMTPGERIRRIAGLRGLDADEIALLTKNGSLDISIANRMIENVITTLEIPVGIATNFLINGKEYLIPMAIEEPSVVAAASNAAGMAKKSGGFTYDASEQVMIGQIQIINLKSAEAARGMVIEHSEEIIRAANTMNSHARATEIDARIIGTGGMQMLVVHVFVDVDNAMGANMVNTICEHIAPIIASVTGGKANLRILSNLATRRIAKARAVFEKSALGGDEIIERILSAYHFALQDPYRAATHNKGIMNGIDAVVLATYNDWRSNEAGAHAYASITGRYLPLTKYEKDANGDLVGSIEIPIQVGVVGGACTEKGKVLRRILGVGSSAEFSGVLAVVGLAQNLAALKALAGEGIQKGHMKLHSRNYAIAAGATGDTIDRIAEEMQKEGNVTLSRAKELVGSLGDSSE